MEDQPRDRAKDRHYEQRGEDRHSTHRTAALKNDQSHFQRQHQETQTKKTGTKKVNISDAEGEKITHLSDTVAMSHPPLAMNGVVNCGLITNGYSTKDNDGSGSEGGYTTPKKRKARCNNAKNTDNVIKDEERDMQQGDTTQESGELDFETTEKGVTSRLDGFRAAHKVEAQSAARRAAVSEASVGESQRKNSDGKTVGTFGKKSEDRHKAKLSSPSKEDSWTLFKPPPVFPVDNSSAKIVPKISYASKVKENLNKVAQGGGEALPPPC
ncbi:unnamed protein product [Pleuronectes platessa]|uniref:Uncharacterized protein n=1 Tax=Pleuronectes platessa TaxID=8262 RepID=A0A9N7YF37_PLEPL|nr:unnamed protein product [Pleuronectes platessa]